MHDLTGLTERRKLRESERRKLQHACDVLLALIKKHMPDEVGEHEAAEVYNIRARLDGLIKHQHVIDPVVKERKVLEGY